MHDTNPHPPAKSLESKASSSEASCVCLPNSLAKIWSIDVATTIHFYEAILACLAILVWHFYHVIFDPNIYPLNWACWNGKVSKHWQEEEHPLEPGPGEAAGKPAMATGQAESPRTPTAAE